ncbi:hypothetical protein GYMLUDRAFT_244259 [Collybiopsis luxurians FD-317 M1]|uniref:ATP-dependent DNA helicase n=1 Tax=Collybiopsis luxurians FD-317 M1 TaxID=944289 RepID=A0A0D0BAF7_9AGAR|nr:hypothetical protein GYMLUDRAFT_244259 [Collybiopsis luxurians FD-317 M1]
MAPSSLKRKAQKSNEDDKLKRSKGTIDSFFSPQVSIASKVSNHHTVKLLAVTLNAEQTMVYRMVVNEGKSVFFTGPAGMGKSLLLQVIIQALGEKYLHNKEAVAVTASTGIAASNIGGPY